MCAGALLPTHSACALTMAAFSFSARSAASFFCASYSLTTAWYLHAQSNQRNHATHSRSISRRRSSISEQQSNNNTLTLSRFLPLLFAPPRAPESAPSSASTMSSSSPSLPLPHSFCRTAAEVPPSREAAPA